MVDSEFGQDLVKRWEEKTGCLHRSDVEINPGQILPYYDHRFVKDLINYAEILYKRQQDTKDKLSGVLDIIKE